ncbi:nicotianamine synthase family protein [Pseudonocardia nematodicida]|uniref:Nicotianamine synthase family protein n=1 Tax=Pseudonocardia nematodicida TaxID=1206997 RepID=A0ABV1KBB4_9PSEU
MTTERSETTSVEGFYPEPRRPHDEHGAAATASRLLDLGRLLRRTDLSPGPVVDAAFGELVGLCCHPPAVPAERILDRIGPEADGIRALCATGEGLMERHWARRIADAADPRAELARFPYLQNYHDLVRLELGALAAAGRPVPRRAVVLGSGPLPLTGLVLARRYGTRVLHVDRDADAADAGQAVAEATGTPGVRSLVADLSAPEPDPRLTGELAAADVVLLGALVGADAVAKDAITARLAAAAGPGTTLLVRSATGLRTLLYPEVRAADLPALEVLLEVHPHTDVVNSVLVARRRTHEDVLAIS